MNWRKNREKIQVRKWLVLLLPFSFFLLYLAQRWEGFAEWVFSRNIYNWIAQIQSFIIGMIPFSVMEWGIVVLPFLFLLLIIWFLFYLIQNKGYRKKIIIKACWNTAAFLAVFFFWYTITCGVNYHRYSFSYYSGLELEEYSIEELEGLCYSLVEQANELRGQLSEVDGVTALSFYNYKEMSREANKAMKKLSVQYPVLKGYYPPVKGIVFSNAMSEIGLTGVYCNFTMESNVNINVPIYTIPATMCHELSHLRGFMREDEANYIGYLACICSDNIEFQYSGVMSALVYAGNRLYKEDKKRYDAVRKMYSTGIMNDLRADSNYWQPYQDTTVSAVSDSINEAFLKANKQSDGLKSYGRIVDLLLAEYRSKNQ